MLAISMAEGVLGAAAFLLVASLWVLAALLWSLRTSVRTRKIRQRIGLAPQEKSIRELRLWRDGVEGSTTVPGHRPRRTIAARLKLMLDRAGWNVSLQKAIFYLIGSSLLSYLVMAATTHNRVLSLAAPATLLFAVWTYLQHCIAKRAAIFDRQFVDGLDLAARSLRAGHPLQAAFRIISEEVPAPVGTVFAEICQQQGVGLSLEQALRRTAAEHDSLDLKLFATSVGIQARSGGNLSEMIERLATVIRSRMWLTARMRVLTAQTQFSKRVLLLLPFVVFIGLNIINPTYVTPLYTTAMGQLLLAAAGGGLLIGALVMRRMAKLTF